MPDRFFSAEPILADEVTLAGEEAHHLIHVLRAKPGTLVTLFDGGGGEFVARIEHVGRAAVTLIVERRSNVDRELGRPLTLAVALPKGDRQRWLVEKLVELGVTRLAPLIAERGVAQPVESALARLRRAVVEASKQCGRNRLMEIAAPLTFTQWCSADARIAVADPARIRAMADPGGEIGAGEWRDRWRAAGAKAVEAAVGPEGGWSDAELRMARERGCEIIHLGPRILRVETAAVALAAMAGMP